jgi:hypothetical protein
MFLAHESRDRGMMSQLRHCYGNLDTVKKCFGLQVKCPLLLADLNLTCTGPSACAESERCDVSVTSLLWKARYSLQKFVLQEIFIIRNFKIFLSMENFVETFKKFPEE